MNKWSQIWLLKHLINKPNSKLLVPRNEYIRKGGVSVTIINFWGCIYHFSNIRESNSDKSQSWVVALNFAQTIIEREPISHVRIFKSQSRTCECTNTGFSFLSLSSSSSSTFAVSVPFLFTVHGDSLIRLPFWVSSRSITTTLLVRALASESFLGMSFVFFPPFIHNICLVLSTETTTMIFSSELKLWSKLWNFVSHGRH